MSFPEHSIRVDKDFVIKIKDEGDLSELDDAWLQFTPLDPVAKKPEFGNGPDHQKNTLSYESWLERNGLRAPKKFQTLKGLETLDLGKSLLVFSSEVNGICVLEQTTREDISVGKWREHNGVNFMEVRSHGSLRGVLAVVPKKGLTFLPGKSLFDLRVEG